MGIFFGKKKTAPGQPHPDWPWSLSVGSLSFPRPDWETLEDALRGLRPDSDSFLILEQKDPADPKNYWFLQSAVNLAGPRPGWYTVEAGWGSKQGKALKDLDARTVEEVIPFFRAAYERKPLDLSKFQDMSDMLG